MDTQTTEAPTTNAMPRIGDPAPAFTAVTTQGTSTSPLTTPASG
jgi:hypothetical protein